MVTGIQGINSTINTASLFNSASPLAAAASFHSEVSDLFGSFAIIANQTESAQLSTSLNVLTSARHQLLTNAPNEVTDFTIDSALTSLWETILQDGPSLSGPERIAISAALYVIGELTLINGESTVGRTRTTLLFRSTADFLKQEEARDVAHEASTLFLEDRHLAHILMATRGWLDSSALFAQHRAPIVSLLTRMGIASLTTSLATHKFRMTSISEQTQSLFGIDVGAEEDFAPLAATSYLRDTLNWGGPATFIDFVLAALLDPMCLDEGTDVLREGVAKFPDHVMLRRLQTLVSNRRPIPSDPSEHHTLWLLCGSRDRALTRSKPRIADFLLQSIL